MRKKLAAILGVRETFFLIGLSLVTAGVWREFGMEYGLMSAGGTLLFVAVRGIS